MYFCSFLWIENPQAKVQPNLHLCYQTISCIQCCNFSFLTAEVWKTYTTLLMYKLNIFFKMTWLYQIFMFLNLLFNLKGKKGTRKWARIWNHSNVIQALPSLPGLHPNPADGSCYSLPILHMLRGVVRLLTQGGKKGTFPQFPSFSLIFSHLSLIFLQFLPQFGPPGGQAIHLGIWRPWLHHCTYFEKLNCTFVGVKKPMEKMNQICIFFIKCFLIFNANFSAMPVGVGKSILHHWCTN